ncbi:MAG TPA: thiolase family protein [Caldimonas sp.]|nr:thiolase family protein [Caldimonas sp.]
MNSQAVIPYGAWWSTPFARWQGSFAHLHALAFAAHVARGALARRGIDPQTLDHGVLGLTVPQRGSFYGLPWLMGEIGATHVAGPTISQACATGARALQSAVAEVDAGMARASLVVCADRTSNGPHVYYPSPESPGGTGEHENWVLDSFERDPFVGRAMIDTAEIVAKKHGIDTARQHALVLHRYEQYADALANGRAFQKRYMDLPFDVPDARYRGTRSTLEGDEGIHETSAEGLARLKPVRTGGTVTHGGQTHPADGNAGVVVASRERASEFTREPAIEIRILGFGQARVDRAHMPEAPVPAARRALEAAGVGIGAVQAIKTHNPFIVNDIVLADALGVDARAMNRYGCSLVWGHPQAPTGLRSLIEMFEGLVMRGGGTGLFAGCAAGDSAMAVVVRVDDRRPH